MQAIQQIYLLASVLAFLLARSQACVYLYGDSPLSKDFAAPKGTPWNYAFHGLDWEGVDSKNVSWQCLSGREQSPINIVKPFLLEDIAKTRKTSMDFGVVTSNGSNVQVINTGATIQVEWTDASWKPDVTVAVPEGATKLQQALEDVDSTKVKRVKASPLQFHWHTASEHFLEGHYYPLELHIVNTVRSDVLPGCTGPLGCLTVVGVLFEVSDDLKAENEFLKPIIAAVPDVEDTTNFMPKDTKLDFSLLIPDNHTYVTYPGSLTTPPCSEGVLWHVLTTPQKISLKQWQAIQKANGDSLCGPTKLADKAAGRKLLGKEVKPTLTCHKLGNAQNYRDPQPVNDRTLYNWRSY